MKKKKRRGRRKERRKKERYRQALKAEYKYLPVLFKSLIYKTLEIMSLGLVRHFTKKYLIFKSYLIKIKLIFRHSHGFQFISINTMMVP